MNPDVKHALEAAGYKVGSASDFLELTDKETATVDGQIEGVEQAGEQGTLKTCEYCQFWHVTSPDGYEGDCKKRSPYPRSQPADDGSHPAVWPSTIAEEWCHEFSTRIQ